MENAQQEPSMEEILASIRRIISEDDDENAGGEKAQPPTQTKTADTGETPAQPRESAPETPAASDEPAASEPATNAEEIEMIKENVATAIKEDAESSILDTAAAAAAGLAFDNLSQQVRISGNSGRTLEDIVIEILKPLIKDWLDQNLPTIVEQKVEEEVRRVSQRRW